ncbi:hypothetical protein D3C87_176940 [compost metagenome]
MIESRPMTPERRKLKSYLPYILAGALLLSLLAMVKSEKLLLQKASRIQQEADLSTYFYIPTWAKNVSEIKEADYRRILAEFQAKYIGPVYQETGKPLIAPNSWSNPYFAGAAVVDEQMAQLILWGGLARAPGATSAVVATVLCHELGHIVGGEPRQSAPLPEWSSSEGQSDFYAATVCLPEYLKAHPELKIPLDAEVKELCKDDKTCGAIAQTGLDFIRFLQRYSYRDFKAVSVLAEESPSPELIRNRYPTDQCRLDNFVKAALCVSSGTTCEPPACWFSEKQK